MSIDKTGKQAVSHLRKYLKGNAHMARVRVAAGELAARELERDIAVLSVEVRIAGNAPG
jgi:hypothetical protein